MNRLCASGGCQAARVTCGERLDGRALMGRRHERHLPGRHFIHNLSTATGTYPQLQAPVPLVNAPMADEPLEQVLEPCITELVAAPAQQLEQLAPPPKMPGGAGII
jgi:hypothetical protein